MSLLRLGTEDSDSLDGPELLRSGYTLLYVAHKKQWFSEKCYALGP